MQSGRGEWEQMGQNSTVTTGTRGPKRITGFRPGLDSSNCLVEGLRDNPGGLTRVKTEKKILKEAAQPIVR